jgi:N-acetylglucosamine kinase-like BadF-type ATPase
MQKYYLGVDGGNSKTEYLLCKTDGTFVDVYRSGTCSHETFPDGYDGTERTMREHLSELFKRNGIGPSDVASAGFGLSGADLNYQVRELKKLVEHLGFRRIGLANDGILGIKGASESGSGLCVVNGTGTVVIGINENGDVLQVGGLGRLAADCAGGAFIRDEVISTMYQYYYRCGDNSSMYADVLALFKAKPEDLLTVLDDWKMLAWFMTDIIKACVKAALSGDEVARRIFDNVGISIAEAAAGCIRRLTFGSMGTVDKPIEIVQVGSLWHKVPYEGMHNAFMKTVQELSGKYCRIAKLEVSPAVGGVLWAKEIADGASPPPEFKRTLLQTMKAAGNLEQQLGASYI